MAIKVKQGDTLWNLYGSDWKRLSGYTGDPTKLPIGTVLPSIGRNSAPTNTGLNYSPANFSPAPNTSSINYTPANKPGINSTPSYFQPGNVGGFSTQNASYQPNPVSKYFQPNTAGGFQVPQQNMSSMPQASGFKPLIDASYNKGMGPSANTGSVQTGFQFPNLVKTAYAAEEVTPSASMAPKRSTEVPITMGGRTPVVHGTPSWVVPIFQKVSEQTGVPTAVLSAVAKHESAGTFDPTIRQRGFGLGRGMFQIDIGQHPGVTEDQAFDPNFATKFAAKLLKEGYDRTGSWEGAFRYYNGGPGYNSNRAGYNGRPVTELTQNYANIVKALMEQTIPVEDPNYKKKIQAQLK